MTIDDIVLDEFECCSNFTKYKLCNSKQQKILDVSEIQSDDRRPVMHHLNSDVTNSNATPTMQNNFVSNQACCVAGICW